MMTMLLVKMMVLAVGGHILGDVTDITSDSPVIETPADEEEMGTWGH